MRKTDEEMKEKLDKRLKIYNRLLDFCRDQPRCKLEMSDEFEAEVGGVMLQSMICTLLKRKMMTATPITLGSRKNVYLTVPGAVFFHLPYHTRKKSTGRPSSMNEEIIRKGNVTIVSANCYYTKGNVSKRSVWIGSSMGAMG